MNNWNLLSVIVLTVFVILPIVYLLIRKYIEFIIKYNKDNDKDNLYFFINDEDSHMYYDMYLNESLKKQDKNTKEQ